MCVVKIITISLVIGLAFTLEIPKEKRRAVCAPVNFNDPTKITYWNGLGGHGPVVGFGINSSDAENMLKTALDNLKDVDEHQYSVDSIVRALKCFRINNMYEFNANLIDNNSQNKNCIVQIYKNYQQSDDNSVTAVVISCPDVPQYFKTYSEVRN